MTRRHTSARPSSEGGRAVALAKLVAPEAPEVAEEEADVVPEVQPSGREVRWDGDTRYLVVADAFCAVFGDLYRSANQGTVLLLDPKTAARGLDSGSLEKV